jgi:P27 family predicted phage terminase small subunit
LPIARQTADQTAAPMPGPPRKPTPLLKLAGSTLAGNRDATEPKPSATAPPMPQWLDAEARAAWKQLVPILERMRVLTEADGLALAMLCNAWSRYRTASDRLDRYGDVYPVKGPDGELKMLRRSPYAALQMEHANTVRRLLAEFGLTPAARGRVVALPESTNGKTSLFTKAQAGHAAG